jgi:hypothetical protein
LQRNPHPFALDVPAIPATVQPGDTVDHPDPIAGFEPVITPDAETEVQATKPTTRKQSTSADHQTGKIN